MQRKLLYNYAFKNDQEAGLCNTIKKFTTMKIFYLN